ncbi:MAG: glycosyl transferase, partial [Persephonella sp.]
MKKTLVIRFSSLGDVILATSVIEPLYRKKYKVDFLTFKPFDQLFINDYRLNRVIALDKKDLKSVKQIKDLAKNLNHYDFIIDLHANFRTKLLSFFSERPFIVYNKRSFKRRMLTNRFFKKFINLSNFNVLNAYQ